METNAKRKPEKGARAAELAAVAVIVASLIVAGAALATPSSAQKDKRPVALKPVATVRCVNSFDPACGPLHWVPAPGPNQPTTTSLSPATARGVVGRPLSFDGRAADPDASIACHWILYGDETAALIPAIAFQRQYGRWSTPAKHAGSYQATFTHTYAKPGTYRVQFGARSGNGCSNDYNPYGGESVSTATVTIAAQ
ncbi:MAG TPA: PKD domain-containing protein [Actinomycetota bacterium]|nr:PKD domain-containing protein [Actinomycetota bacterium]